MRPLLRPGVHVLHRGDGHVQLGLDPAAAVLLPDQPEVRALLGGLDGSAHPDDDAVLSLLASESLVVDEQSVLPLLGPGVGPGGRPAAAALARHRGEAAIAAAASRRSTTLQAVGFGLDCSADGIDLLAELTGLAERVGMQSRCGSTTSGKGGQDTGMLGAVVGVGEPARELLDPWTQAGTPYVVVRMTEGRAVVGPFVVPGETACLRCIDAHHTDTDRALPLLVHQYSRATSRDRTDGLTEPVDPILVTLAVAWATRDLASYVDGVRPSTWSSTVTFDAQLGSIESRCWMRHPECGCSWH
ncbi:cyclodehydratase [soil metagenome]